MAFINEKSLRKINRPKNAFLPAHEDAVSVLPNSLVMRVMQDDNAEQEADRLSKGVMSASPDGVKTEMGRRLGTDFSKVNFHSGPDAVRRSEALGARAWTSGKDIYFGKGGFAPDIAAHEMVHTIQQGAVGGSVSADVPYGSVQLKPKKKADEEADDMIPRTVAPTAEGFEQSMTEDFNTRYGIKLYKAIEGDLKDMIKKGAGKKVPGYTKAAGIHFLALAAERDYSAKGIMADILQTPITTKNIARDQLFKFQQFIQFVSNRMGEYGLEGLAMETGLINKIPEHEHKDIRKRAYETEMPGEKLKGKTFNPNNIPELGKIQKEIDDAKDAKTAYKIFASYTGNPKGKYIDKFDFNLDLRYFKQKLKNMTRVVYDYPELHNQIGNMLAVKDVSYVMSTDPTIGGREKATFKYNASLDLQGDDKKRLATYMKDKKDRRVTAPNMGFTGTHEMGHVLASLLPNSGDKITDLLDENNGKYEDEILKEVIENKNVMTEEQKQNIHYHKSDGNYNGLPFRKGQIDTHSSGFYSNDLTSKYGTSASAEFFAEAFADVYYQGKDARPMSKEIVKEYEKRQTKMTKQKFFEKKPSLWRRFKNMLNIL